MNNRISQPKTWIAGCLLVLILLPSAYLCMKARDGAQLGFFQDDGLYLTGAKSLVENGTYTIPSLPAQPYQTKYPPLYPILLAAIWKLRPSFPANLKWFVLLDWCLWVAFLGMAFTVFRSWKLNCAAQWGGLAVLASNAGCLFLTMHFMSEALFSSFLIGALLLAEHASRNTRRPNTIALCAAFCAACAFLTKTAALPIALTVPFAFLMRRQYTRALSFIAVVVPVIMAWVLWTATHRRPSSDPVLLYYTDYFGFYRFNVSISELPAIVTHNIGFFLRSVAGIVPAVPGLEPLAIISTGACILGTVRLLMDTKAYHVACFLVCYMLQVLAWNFSPNLRFLYPMLPFLVAGFTYEACHIVALIRRSLPPRFATGITSGNWRWILCCVAVGTYAVVSKTAIERNLAQLKQYREATSAKRAAYAWVTEHLPACATFAVYDDPSLYLYTGRHGIRNEVLTRPYLLGDTQAVERPIAQIGSFAREHGLAYLFWSRDDYAIDGVLHDTPLRERLLERNHGLQLLYGTPNVRIYAVQVY
jgi:hypothetical protein